jgi:hypothetical protein
MAVDSLRRKRLQEEYRRATTELELVAVPIREDLEARLEQARRTERGIRDRDLKQVADFAKGGRERHNRYLARDLDDFQEFTRIEYELLQAYSDPKSKESQALAKSLAEMKADPNRAVSPDHQAAIEVRQDLERQLAEFRELPNVKPLVDHAKAVGRQLAEAGAPDTPAQKFWQKVRNVFTKGTWKDDETLQLEQERAAQRAVDPVAQRASMSDESIYAASNAYNAEVAARGQSAPAPEQGQELDGVQPVVDPPERPAYADEAYASGGNPLAPDPSDEEFNEMFDDGSEVPNEREAYDESDSDFEPLPDNSVWRA